MALLSPAAVADALRPLPRWRYDADARAIAASLRFADFSAAWAFMSRVALHAERVDHHPDWSNVYGRVEIALTTHDAGGVTARDIDFAHAIDGWAGD